MELEDDRGIKIENEVAEVWAGRTLGDVVDTLLAKCQPPSINQIAVFGDLIYA